MIKQDAFNRWWSDEGGHLPFNIPDMAEAAWEACEIAHKSGLVELALRCRLEGMLAANRDREARGEAPAYPDESFQYLGKDAWRLAGMGVEMPTREENR